MKEDCDTRFQVGFILLGQDQRRPPAIFRKSEGRGVFVWVLLALSLLLMTPGGASAAMRADERRMLDTSTLGDPIAYDVDPGGAVLVLTRDNIFEGGTGKFLFEEPLKDPEWLSFAGGKLQFLADNALFVADGKIQRKLLDVPLKNRIFVSDEARTFISGVTEAGRPVLFIYKAGMGHKALLELDLPIGAMTLARGELFFTVGAKIYALKEGGQARLFAHLTGYSHIPSVAVDDRLGLLYFSAGDNIFAVLGGNIVVARQGIEGMLRFRGGNLYVLSRREHAMYRMDGISEAVFSAGAQVPFKDACKAPVLSLYCGAEAKRAVLKSIKEFAGSMAIEDASARKELGAYMAGQKGELEGIMAGLEKEAVTGAQAVLWGGGRDPKTIGSNTAIATDSKGIGLTMWDGSGIRVGPDSKMIVDECRPSMECKQALDKGLLYFEAYKSPVEGMAAPVRRGYVIDTKTLSLRFGSARIAVFASGDQTAVVVLEGRAKAVTPQGESVIIVSGETLEARRGEAPGMPVPAEMERLKKWWEDIR